MNENQRHILKLLYEYDHEAELTALREKIARMLYCIVSDNKPLNDGTATYHIETVEGEYHCGGLYIRGQSNPSDTELWQAALSHCWAETERLVIPDYPTSVDAALSLLPENKTITIGRTTIHGVSRWRCDIAGVMGHGDTLSETICLAWIEYHRKGE